MFPEIKTILNLKKLVSRQSKFHAQICQRLHMLMESFLLGEILDVTHVSAFVLAIFTTSIMPI